MTSNAMEGHKWPFKKIIYRLFYLSIDFDFKKLHFNDAKILIYVMERLRDLFQTFKSSNLISTLNYVLMDNFCPCLISA